MSDLITPPVHLPEEQKALRAKCFHPGGSFVEFGKEEVEQSIPERFEKIVRQFPGRIAFKTRNEVLSYAELNAMANRVAHALLERQGPKAQLVAILMEKDVPQLAAMLGVMKAGKFFLILDPSFPKARLAAMLDDSRARLVLTHRDQRLLPREPGKDELQFLDWENISPAIFSENPGLAVPAKALAFINYTSGSTGEPKGLLRTHRMILHNIMLRTNIVHVCEHDRISLLSSGTSNAITNTFLALLNGAGLFSLDLKKEGVMRLAGWLSDERITICPMSSPLFRSLCGTLSGRNNFPDLRVVRLRSEAVYKNDADLYKTYFSPDCIFVTGLSSNETGPLRDFLIDRRSEVSGSSVPVGYAVPGKEILLLDDSGNEVAPGEVGEIAVRSRYLAPGYLRRPQLTKAKFRPDPKRAGERLYLTGDLGVMLPDGCLVYKGRKDFRIKIRGYGVDLKEVELAFRDHPAVADAVVVVRENESREKELVGYFSSSFPIGPTAGELRSFLRSTLPDYMIPSAFVKLDSIPLTPHNKVDRNALPPPGHSRPELGIPFRAPRTPLEQELAKIWAEVLCREQVGMDDNFFDLGGHSLTATRIISRVIQTRGLQVPPQALFDSPTVAQMAVAIMSLEEVAGGSAHASQGNAKRNKVGPTNEFIDFDREDLEQSIPDRFEKIARLYPDRVAVKMKDRVATYSQLNATANRLARVILAQPGDQSKPVGLLFGKGIAQIAAMMGVLKAGKCFVIIDPSLPRSRITAVLDDAQVSLLVAEREHALFGKEAASENCRLVEFQSIDPGISAEDLCLDISPMAFACIVYTSGSSGQPKGVIQNHQNLLHRIKLYTHNYHICAQDRISLLSFGTSSAVTNTLCALLNGATLLSFDVRKEGVGRLAGWLIQERVSVCWISAPLFRKLCGNLTREERFPDLRLIGLRSEAVLKTDFELYKKYFRRECLFSSSLSSTESGTLGIYFADHDTEIAGNEVPVGYPMADKEILLLDDEGKKVGFHRVGEIVVRSRYLSPGYWRRPELTEAKFKHDPENIGSRLYYTGDLGLMLPDGCLIHKGRKDFRIKVRGYGVELAEVEKVLRGHAAVGDAAVLARVNHAGETALVAYFTCTDSSCPSVSELRSFMNKKLPDYMIPPAFQLLDALPLTPNGKVDRKALPPPGKSRPALSTSYIAPNGPEEKRLVKIWSEALSVDDIGVHDSFFDLGGHSLLAMQVLSRIRDDFQIDLPLSQFFDTPTIDALAGYIIEKSRPARGGTEDQLLQAALKSEPIPPSFAQQRLWFLDQLEPGSSRYNLFSARQFKGELSATALEQSLNEVIKRHEVLRTTFKTIDGQPFQRIDPSMTIKLPVVDLRGIASDSEKEAEFRRLAAAEAQRPFDLARGPLLRATLLRLTDDEHILLLTLHHIVFDGWSRGILAKELATLYEGFAGGYPSSLPALPIQYADFAQWQRKWLQGEVLKAQLAYWKKQLENVSTLRLPSDQPAVSVQSAQGAREYFVLSERLSAELKRLSRRQGATLFMTLLAAYQILLHRYAGQDDIVVASPTAGRNRSETERIIGFFINMLVLRNDLSGNPTFRELLARVRETCLDAYTHQDLPFEKLVEELHPERNLSHNPLFQVTFALQNAPTSPLKLSGLTAKDLEVDPGIARFDLHLFLEEEEGRLQGYISYMTDLFSPEMIGRMVAHFQTLLEGIVADPEKRLSDLPLLTAAERHQLLAEWNNTKEDYPRDRCLDQIFEEQAEKTPEAVAVQAEDQRLTYRELNRRANQLAHYLQKLGVGPEVLVAICMERSLEMMVGILGILKAGGAYVPLDPAYPKERLASMLDDSRAAVLLTQQQLIGSLPERGARRVCVDSDWEVIAREKEDDPVRTTTADNLAYVIYSSGSTGRPKGVLVTHCNVTRLFQATHSWFHFNQNDVWTLFHSYAFDFSVWEMWGALLYGGRLVIVSHWATRSPQLFYDLLRTEGVTVLNQTPSAFRQLIQTETSSSNPLDLALRLVIFGGEALDFGSLRPWFDRHGDQCPQLVNMYGITETTVHVTYRPITAEDSSAARGSLIGMAIPDLELYVLDQNQNPVPLGVPGELYVGGAGLGRGYLNRFELTADRFIPNPFSPVPGERLYRSGDLVRYLPSRDIEYLGRMDAQVKIRGFRIELGEIEAALRGHHAVGEAVVVAREDGGSTDCELRMANGEDTNPQSAILKTTDDRSSSPQSAIRNPQFSAKRLVAYVIPNPEQSPSTSDLRGFLKEKLPDYMVPSAFVMLDALPLTPNGKVDRKALPAPEQTRPELQVAFVAPKTPIEKAVARIWGEVLRLEQVGIHDNFFDLGGHSLIATQVVSRIREAFSVMLSLRSLVESPTVAGLAECIEVVLRTAGKRQSASGGGLGEREQIKL